MCISKVKKILTGIFALASLSLIVGLCMKPFSDFSEFQRLYNKMDSDSVAFQGLRDSFLTPAYDIVDYSATTALLALSILCLLGPFKRSPRSKGSILITGLVAVVLSCAASIWDIFQAVYRYEVPHWADSTGIPLAGTFVIAIALGIWALLHSLFLKGECLTSVDLFEFPWKKWNPWLAFVLFSTALVIALCAAGGNFEFIIPGFIWIYFYQSLNAGRAALKH